MFLKYIILAFCLFFIPLFSYSYYENELSLIEQNSFGKSFDNESLSDRLNRLETNYFGMSQSGDIDSRFDKLFKMAESKEQSPAFVPSFDFQEFPKTKKSTIRKFFDALTYPFDTGSYTGYTPPFNYSTGYSTSNSGLNPYFDNSKREYCPYHRIGKRILADDSDYSSFQRKKYNRFSNRVKHPYRKYNRNRYPSMRNSYANNNSLNHPSVLSRNGNFNIQTGSRVRILND